MIILASGYEVQVDDDCGFLKRWTWRIHLYDGRPSAVVRTVKRSVYRYIHQEVLAFHGISADREVDHKSRDVLDNRFENLRPASHEQNSWNKGLTKRNTTGYKGIYYDTSRGKYTAHITCRTHRTTLGRFVDPVEAAKAYDKAAKLLHGEFACLNFPEST